MDILSQPIIIIFVIVIACYYIIQTIVGIKSPIILIAILVGFIIAGHYLLINDFASTYSTASPYVFGIVAVMIMFLIFKLGIYTFEFLLMGKVL